MKKRDAVEIKVRIVIPKHKLHDRGLTALRGGKLVSVIHAYGLRRKTSDILFRYGFDVERLNATVDITLNGRHVVLESTCSDNSAKFTVRP